MEELQQTLDSSWQEEEETLREHLESSRAHDSFRQGSSQEISSLALNLSSQAEYNNELLQYIQHLEGQYSDSLRYVEQLEREAATLQQQCKRTAESATEGGRQLAQTSSLYEELVEVHREQSSAVVALQNQHGTLREETDELLRERNSLQRDREASRQREAALARELAAAREKRLISDDDCTDSIATLTLSLEVSSL